MFAGSISVGIILGPCESYVQWFVGVYLQRSLYLPWPGVSRILLVQDEFLQKFVSLRFRHHMDSIHLDFTSPCGTDWGGGPTGPEASLLLFWLPWEVLSFPLYRGDRTTWGSMTRHHTSYGSKASPLKDGNQGCCFPGSFCPCLYVVFLVTGNFL